MKYKEAEDLAKELSIKNSGVFYYINWIEGNDWSVDRFPEFGWQDFYFKGECIYREEYYGD